MEMSVGNAHPFQLASAHSGLEIIKTFQSFVGFFSRPDMWGGSCFNVPSTDNSPASRPHTFALFETLCSFASDAWADQLEGVLARLD